MKKKRVTLDTLKAFTEAMGEIVQLRKSYDFSRANAKDYTMECSEVAYDESSMSTMLSGEVSITMPRESAYDVVINVKSKNEGSYIVYGNESYPVGSLVTLRYTDTDVLEFKVVGTIWVTKITATESVTTGHMAAKIAKDEEGRNTERLVISFTHNNV